MSYEVGATVVDATTREEAVIRHVERVPRHRDLFGTPVRSHHRYTIVFPDGRWALRGDSDLDPRD